MGQGEAEWQVVAQGLYLEDGMGWDVTGAGDEASCGSEVFTGGVCGAGMGVSDSPMSLGCRMTWTNCFSEPVKRQPKNSSSKNNVKENTPMNWGMHGQGGQWHSWFWLSVLYSKIFLHCWVLVTFATFFSGCTGAWTTLVMITDCTDDLEEQDEDDGEASGDLT